ncbi:MAG: hypothetical protein ACM3QS_08610 [Bacteroidota bacterium]
MKRNLSLLLAALALAGCDVFKISPQPFPVWTAIPTRTPGVVTPTPIILIPTMTASATSTAGGTQQAATPTDTATPAAADTATLTPRPAVQIQVEVLGCNTGIDISHGMGEVTNAYVILRNTGSQDLPHTCALLRAGDEEREHPDKTRCVDVLPSGYQVTLKLTVDSAFKQDTVIQVDASSDSTLLQRVDKPSCTDLDIVSAIPGDIGVLKPIVP